VAAAPASDLLVELAQRLAQRDSQVLSRSVNQAQRCCREDQQADHQHHPTADQCIDEPLAAAAAAMQCDDQDRGPGGLVDEHQSVAEEATPGGKSGGHRDQHGHPDGHRSFGNGGHPDPDADAQRDTGDQLQRPLAAQHSGRRQRYRGGDRCEERLRVPQHAVGEIPSKARCDRRLGDRPDPPRSRAHAETR